MPAEVMRQSILTIPTGPWNTGDIDFSLCKARVYAWHCGDSLMSGQALLKSQQLNVKLLLPVWAWNAEVKTWHLSAGLANSVEALYFTTELHTSSVRV